MGTNSVIDVLVVGVHLTSRWRDQPSLVLPASSEKRERGISITLTSDLWAQYSYSEGLAPLSLNTRLNVVDRAGSSIIKDYQHSMTCGPPSCWPGLILHQTREALYFLEVRDAEERIVTSDFLG